jgi:tetratricopeptide (TPR) repeat protein
MFFTPTGDVVACCETQSLRLGNVNEADLASIWNGAAYARLRAQSIAYDLPPACAFCTNQIAIANWQGTTARHFDHYPLPSTAPQWPRVMEFSFGNLCNLACIMCNGDTSSRIRANEGRSPLPMAYGDAFFAQLRPFLPHLQTVKLLGGEPFLMPETYRLLQMLQADGLRPTIVVTTNGTRFDARIEQALAQLPISIMLSMDGATKATFERIRVGADFATVRTNALRFLGASRKYGNRFGFIFTLQRDNWHELGDFLLFAEALDVKVELSLATAPTPLALELMPPAAVAELQRELQRQQDRVLPQLQRNATTWRSALAAAMACCTQPTTTRPSQPPAGYQKAIEAGKSELQRNDLEGAQRCFDDAVALAPDRPEALLERGWLHRRRRRDDAAKADAERALAGATTHAVPGVEAPTLALLAVLAAASGDTTATANALDRLLAIEPDSPRALVWSGWARLAAGQPQMALADADRALASSPTHDEARRLQQAAMSALRQ